MQQASGDTESQWMDRCCALLIACFISSWPGAVGCIRTWGTSPTGTVGSKGCHGIEICLDNTIVSICDTTATWVGNCLKNKLVIHRCVTLCWQWQNVMIPTQYWGKMGSNYLESIFPCLYVLLLRPHGICFGSDTIMPDCYPMIHLKVWSLGQTVTQVFPSSRVKARWRFQHMHYWTKDLTSVRPWSTLHPIP